MERIVSKGAEAVIRLEKGNVIKDRIPKGYRLKLLDEKIRRMRTRSEMKLLEKASKVANVPSPLEPERENQIIIPYIDGKRLSENLEVISRVEQKMVAGKIGMEILKLHRENIIHGDLTTSNMILNGKDVFFIDFGLGFISNKIEDKAVDLHLLKQALEAKHFKVWELLWKEIEKSYIKWAESKKVLERLKRVEKRGRYKDRY